MADEKPSSPEQSLLEWDRACRRARRQSRQHALDSPGDYVILPEGQYVNGDNAGFYGD